MSEPTVLYDEHDSIAVITLNRPDKLNALTNDMVQGVADAIATATASADVGAIVLRGAGASLTAGYDLSSIQEFSGPTQPDTWDTPYDAPGPTPRPGNWDPVRDYQFMNHNVRRYRSLASAARASSTSSNVVATRSWPIEKSWLGVAPAWRKLNVSRAPRTVDDKVVMLVSVTVVGSTHKLARPVVKS